MREFAYIDWLRNRVAPGPQTTIGIGDDAAGYRFTPGREVLVTTDMLLDGTCFVLAEAGPLAVGRKALAVNLSDIAAMAGVPKAAVVSLALPRKDGAEIARGLFEGIETLAREFGVEIVGGDTNSWDGPLAISITLFGEATETPPVRRSGAEVGDWIFVTGPLGGSILGRHLAFVPRVEKALELNGLGAGVHAMVDLSDGLSRDLFHICTESGVGARLHSEWIPISDDARTLSAKDGISPLEHALNDGEDFELCFCVPPEFGELLVRNRSSGCTHIGFIEPAETYEILIGGVPVKLEPRGYEHRFE